MLKKLTVIFTALLMIFSFCACEDGSAKTHVVSFETFGGSEYEPLTVAHDGLIEEPMIPISGNKSFKGWYKDENFSQKWDFATDTVDKDLTLYARFVTTYNVSYWYEGNMYLRKKVNEGETAENVEYLGASRKVVSWYLDEDLSRIYDFDAPVTQNLSLYAYATVVTTWSFPECITMGTGWTIIADTTDRRGTVTAVEDGMKVTFDEPSAWDTYLRSPELSIPCMENYTKIKITYKNLSKENNLKIYYFTTSDKNWSPAKSGNFPYLKTEMSETDPYETLEINIAESSLQANWSGTLYLLRLEIHKKEGFTGEDLMGGTIIIGSISLEK
ncbi:MAG: InlB B-repeat-containing protein [Christensenellales bacterium]